MANRPARSDDKSETPHPAADIERIVVDPDDVIAVMERNNRDRDERRSHSLKLSPPLNGDKQANPCVMQSGNYYPPEMDPKPVHIGAQAVVIGDTAGKRHPDWRKPLSYPNYDIQRSSFRDECDLSDDNGEKRPLTDAEQNRWQEWWDPVVEVWESHVRHALRETDRLTMRNQHPSVTDTTVAVSFQDSDE